MINFKKITIKNFLSVGESPQTIDLDADGLTLILGINNDTTNDSVGIGRNGVGKSTIINSICYALYGEAVDPDIKRKDALVNNINERGMFVILEFEKDGHQYKIERGRKPNFFRFIVDNLEVNTQESDESQGESRHTQEELLKVIGISDVIFKNIIALTTLTVPFLSMTVKQQREFIEELLGVHQLSQKADNLKELLKTTKEEIKNEEFRIKTVNDSNARIQNTIADLKRSQTSWSESRLTKQTNLEEAIAQLLHVDIDAEILNHDTKAKFKELDVQLSAQSRDYTNVTNTLEKYNKQLKTLEENIENTKNKQCHTCGQELHDSSHLEILKDLNLSYEELKEKISKKTIDQEALEVSLLELDQKIQALGEVPETFYDSIQMAYQHKSSIDGLQRDLENSSNEQDPYINQISTLETSGLQEFDFENVNILAKLRDHQDFLLKLLTNKDSFVRKRIIDQNLAFLNTRLSKYLEKVGMQHLVNFNNDLTVDITYAGKALDFGNLSRGERTRLILGLSWAFRDVYELLNSPINLLMVDELFDSGLDQQGVEGAMSVIKQMVGERGRNIFIISHREELISKIGNVLKVVKDGGFSSFSKEEDFNL